MIHTFVGQLGHLSVIIAFVTAIFSAIFYWKSFTTTELSIAESWKDKARFLFYGHAISVIVVVSSLFYILYNHYYEYHYSWSHSSNNLPGYYITSSFWEGQEGSFLVWIFWHVLIGILLIRTSKKWESSTMFVFAAVQVFLLSMVLGINFWGTKIGSSPFILLRDAIDAPIFLSDPNFIPEDGTGLNPLLQNYWMVIHPPTLFLGFALTLVPFAFAIAGLITKEYKSWIKPAFAWSAVGALILGVGIIMGAYWAYETLNFGGYWNWDPVENAVYVPWLTLVASLHLFVVFQRSGRGLTAAIILAITTFLLILYSTFLTRSGVLGEASVHSFTDLGLSGQLLIYLAFFIILSGYLLIKRWKEIPQVEGEAEVYSADFWIFIGMLVLILSAFQVIVPTSIPAWNAFWKFFGISSNVAPPADQVVFYTKFQLWFAVGIALISATAQFFFWKRLDSPKKLKEALFLPVAITLLISASVIILSKISDPAYILLLTASIYSLVSNTIVVWKLSSSANMKIAGGAVSHIGVAMMLIGILYSSGFERVISLNTSGRVYNSEFPEEMNKENLLLFRSEPKRMKNYQLTYLGPRMTSRDVPGYINKELLFPVANDPYHTITKEDIVVKGKTYAQKGDTIQIYNENVYYEVEYRRDDGEIFTLFPRVQHNEQMGPIPSPDIAQYWGMDLYTHITNLAVEDNEVTWSKPEMMTLSIGDTTFLQDFVVIFDGIKTVDKVVGIENMDEVAVAIEANLRVLNSHKSTSTLKPMYVIQNNTAGLIPHMSRDLGLRVTFDHINTETNQFTFAVETAQRDWIILKAIEKPLISFLWIGVIVMSVGMIISSLRRFADLSKANRLNLKEKKETVSETVS